MFISYESMTIVTRTSPSAKDSKHFCQKVLMPSTFHFTATEEMNEDELLGEGDGEETMGDSDGEEIPEDEQEEGLCMDEEEGEMMDEMAEDEDQFPDSNLDDDGNEFPEVCKALLRLSGLFVCVLFV